METRESMGKVFGYELDQRSTTKMSSEKFTEVYISNTKCYITKCKFILSSCDIRNCEKYISYKLLVSAYLDPYKDFDPYAELVFIPCYHSLNKHFKAEAMKIANNDVVKLIDPMFPLKMYEESPHVMTINLIQQTSDFCRYENQNDFQRKFYDGFAQIYENITNNMDLYFDRERSTILEPYWEELNYLCGNDKL